MIEIDGSAGEGGGQILRSALALSMVTGEAFRIERIRANRDRPGLLRQHLTAVRAAGSICNARVRGAELGSPRLGFAPGPVVPGEYLFEIGTAGSTTLVLQAVAPALLLAAEPSTVIIEGGTHNPSAPPIEFVQRSFAPVLARMGLGLEVERLRSGFYPAGGGRIRATFEPADAVVGVDLASRGGQLAASADAIFANLPAHIARRELAVVRELLGVPDEACRVREHKPVDCAGNALVVTLEFEQVTEVFTGFGERRVPAEEVATGACEQARTFLESAAAVGPYLADQLLVPIALAGSGSFTTIRPTDHTLTNAAVVAAFTGKPFAIDEIENGLWRIALG